MTKKIKGDKNNSASYKKSFNKSKNNKSKNQIFSGKRKFEDEDELSEVELDNAIHLTNPSKKNNQKNNKSKLSNDKEGRGGLKKHKQDLEGLKEKDPEFYNFLQENDQDLLNFSDEEDEESDMYDELEDDEEGLSNDEDSQDSSAYPTNRTVEVTSELLNKIIKSSKTSPSLNTLKKLLSIFRSACIPLKSDEDDEGPSSGFIISSPDVYEKAMKNILKSSHVIFYKLLDLPTNPSEEDLNNMIHHAKWKRIQIQILSFYKSILHTLANLIDSTKQDLVTVFILSSLEPYIPLLAPLPRLAKGKVLKVLLAIWSRGSTPGEDFDLRGHAFLRVRQMAIILPGTISEECFRSIYLTFARFCKSFNEQNRTTVYYMIQCVSELYKSDISHAYHQAFLYIRQLALHLRSAVIKKDEEAIRQTTSWQFFNCIQLWTRGIH